MKKRLLFIIHSLSMGGAERVACNLANYWVNEGYRVCIATMSDVDTDFFVLDPRIERISLNSAKPSKSVLSALINNLFIIKKMRRFIRHWKPEISIAFMTTANVHLALASWRLDTILIGSEHIHPPMLPLGFLWEKLRQLSYGRLNAVVSLTEESAAWLRNNTKAQNISVIQNPIPWPLVSQEPYLDVRTALKPNRRYILAVGRLSYQKGFDLLIKVFAKLSTLFPAWDLIIAGEGPSFEALNVLIKSKGLEDRILLLGKVGNIGDWYAACDLYVMSSRFEGFGNTLAEALTYGTPAVSFDCDTGPSEIIRHGVDGVLVPKNDVQSLEKAIKDLIEDDVMREDYGKKAIDARVRFSVQRIASQWEYLFNID